MRDPLSLGFIGRNGAYPANQAGRHADLVLAIGARFDDRSASSWLPGYSWNFPQTRLIHVDIDHAEIGRNYAPDLGILADARAFLEPAAVRTRPARQPSGAPRLQAWHEADRRLARGVGGLRRARTSRSTRRRCGPSASSPTAARCCRTTRSSRWIPASTTTGSCSSGRRAGRRRCSTPGAISGMGFGPCGDPGRQARGARSALRRGLRRRRLHDGAARAVHRGRVRHPGRLGGLEQLRLGARSATCSTAYFDGREIGTAFYQGPEPRALQPRLRGLGARPPARSATP